VLTSLLGDFFFFPFSSWSPLPGVCRAASHSCRPVLAVAVSDLSSCFLSLCADVPPRGFFFFPFSSQSPLPTVCGTTSHSCRPVLAVAVSDPSSRFLSLCADVPPGGVFFFPFSSRLPRARSFPQCPLSIVPIQPRVISHCCVVIKFCCVHGHSFPRCRLPHMSNLDHCSHARPHCSLPVSRGPIFLAVVSVLCRCIPVSASLFVPVPAYC